MLVSDLHRCRTSSHLPALSHAVQLTPAIGLRLALHVVVIVGLASCADEVAGAQEGSGGSADLLHLGDVVGEGSGVDEDVLVEAGEVSCGARGTMAAVKLTVAPVKSSWRSGSGGGVIGGGMLCALRRAREL